jgi:hypothetical protein
MSPFRSLTLYAVLSVVATAMAPIAVTADDDVIPPKHFGRKLPVGTYCAFPEIVSFTPPGSSVIVYFDAQLYIDDGFGNLEFTGQAIDNIVMAPSAQVAENSGVPAGDCQLCYVDDIEPPGDGNPPPVSCFYFNRPGPTYAMRELFDTDPTARGWDMSDAFFVSLPGYSAPRNPEACSDETGGSLVLGHAVPAPSPDLVATTSNGTPIARTSWGRVKSADR